MSFPRYPEYKDSGVEWLGEVPGHWGVISIKWLSPVRRGASPRPIDDPKYFDADGEFSWVRIADVSACDGVLTETTQQLSELGSSLSVKVVPGDLFVSIAGTVGKPCLSAIKACIHDGFVYFPTLQIDPKFLYRIFEGGTCYGGLGKWGTQLNLNTDTIGSIRVALPPPDELKAVLIFLDRETAKIDALVAEQRRLMALLKEKRQAVISHAVTRGLNPHAPMKPSGIEWLGDVPEHWTCIQVGKVCKKVADGPHFSPNYVDEGVPFLSARNVKVNSWSLDDVKYISERDCDEFDRRVFPEVGDVLYTKGGTTGIARVVDLPHRFQVWVHISVLKIKPEIVDPYFLAFALNSVGCYEQSQLLTRGASNNDLGLTRMIKIWFVVPQLDEQVAIINFLNAESAKFDTLTLEAQRAIDLLQERRTALISTAVTGQIDVRGAT
jgi:type I restriction enzyme S subunit